MAGFTSTQTFTNSGRGGYNGPASSSDSDDESRTLTTMNFGRGGYNKGPDDDEEEDGRGGYN
ncbi:hypothetical protein BKA65DRAFT_414544 [Rhexocercosporidium sp. MPI-PUGE-AT-0058]|nr:hypothetical protein BKA65DRAFT_414544 [Rhexocercosporidium sp. MPI-PUGE-AT-0058]